MELETSGKPMQPTFTPGWINHPGLKVGCIFVARQNPLYSRAVATPGTKGRTFSPGFNHHPGLKVPLYKTTPFSLL